MARQVVGDRHSKDGVGIKDETDGRPAMDGPLKAEAWRVFEHSWGHACEGEASSALLRNSMVHLRDSLPGQEAGVHYLLLQPP